MRPRSLLPKLRVELDAAILLGERVGSYASFRNLSFLKRCTDEMRLHSTSAIGLPQIVTSEGVKFDAVRFPTGTVVSRISLLFERIFRVDLFASIVN